MSELIHVAVIPARPGYKLVTGDDWCDDGTDTIPPVYLDPIIGWQVTVFKRDDGSTYSFTTPVTMDGADEHSRFILHPNGVVEKPLDEWFRNQAEFAKYLRSKARGRNT